MQWKNVKLIYHREMRDQLRDRRTLFLIAVLPLLLYPLLGTSFFQLSQFLQQHDAKVLVVGSRQLRSVDWLPNLIRDHRFDPRLFDDPALQEGLHIVYPRDFPEHEVDLRKGRSLPPVHETPVEEADDDTEFDVAARRLLDSGEVEAVLLFPNGFADRLREMRRALLEREAAVAANFPEPVILYNSADDKSQLAQIRVEQVVRRWRNALTEVNLTASDVPVEATKPFELRPRDVAEVQQRQAALWSKVLPFFVFIWALTGAFYPAVDLCAGEKERGTLETLLTSPALRREIVWGKLLTVMTFSIVTALLNLGSLGVTGKFVINQLSQVPAFGQSSALSMPPAASLVWLAAALIPISALFSAMCLACAAFARSTKEGQYYLMPLMLVTFPLMMLPMSPGVELNLGNSLVPLTGLTLLLRSLIEGQYPNPWFFVTTIGVTLLCCMLAIRWAEEQFNRESVLFRESERLELGRWLVHLVRDRSETPSFSQGVLCVAIMLVVQFFVQFAIAGQLGEEFDFLSLVKVVVTSQLACILTPAMLMAVILTRRPLRTLLLEHRPKWAHLAAAAGLALLLHPIVVRMLEQVTKLYPIKGDAEGIGKAIESALQQANPLYAVALIGLLPAVCEELAFRGFVLSGLRHIGHKWWAIALSAFAFGFVHTFLQQQINGFLVGIILGYVAVQTGSLWPCILLHAVHNSLQIGIRRVAEEVERNPNSLLKPLLEGDQPLLYHPVTVGMCIAGVLAILWSLRGESYSPTPEEQLEEARQRQDATLAAVH